MIEIRYLKEEFATFFVVVILFYFFVKPPHASHSTVQRFVFSSFLYFFEGKVKVYLPKKEDEEEANQHKKKSCKPKNIKERAASQHIQNCKWQFKWKLALTLFGINSLTKSYYVWKDRKTAKRNELERKIKLFFTAAPFLCLFISFVWFWFYSAIQNSATVKL